MSVLIKRENTVVRVIFHNPPVNALPGDLLDELEAKLREVAEDKSVKTVVLQSEGRTFCAGASFEELLALDNFEKAKAFFLGFGKVMLQMSRMPQPVITLVQGKTVGGGVGLVAASDLVIATEKASFKLSELSIGIGPYVIAPAIIRKVGISVFQKMSMQPWQWFTAFEMQRAGMITHVVENSKGMEEILEIMISNYAKYDWEAINKLKREIWQDTAGWNQLFEKQAEKSASLLLRTETKKTLEKLRK